MLGNWVCFRNWRRRQRLLCFGVLIVGTLLGILLLINTLRLILAASSPVDTFFVLGGSIRREVYVAELVKEHPEARVLISHGSSDPCIVLIFQKFKAPIRQVWLEKCADSTFDNFYYNLPILRQWGVRKVSLITSPTHLPRAKWMAQILLGAHGIWVEVEAVKELGIPGNRESWLKTGADVIRSLAWAVLSQVIEPQCSELTRLSDVDFAVWRKSGFKCEHQWWLNLQSRWK